jgi:hypothetical protein
MQCPTPAPAGVNARQEARAFIEVEARELERVRCWRLRSSSSEGPLGSGLGRKDQSQLGRASVLAG